jgi:uncharacterized protein (TIGR00369 family)
VVAGPPTEDELGEGRRLASGHAFDSFTWRHVTADGADYAMEMDATDSVSNGTGSIQGGLLATLIDTVASMALLRGAEAYDQAVTMDLHVSYHAAAGVGPVLATAHVLRRGGRSASVRVEVVDLGASRAHVATGLLSFAARRAVPTTG